MENIKHSYLIDLSQTYFLCIFKLLSEISILESTIELQPKKNSSEDYIQALVLKGYEKFLIRSVKLFEDFIRSKDVEDFFKEVERYKHTEQLISSLSTINGFKEIEGLLNGEVLIPNCKEIIHNRMEKIKEKTEKALIDNHNLSKAYEELERQRLDLENSIKSTLTLL